MTMFEDRYHESADGLRLHYRRYGAGNDAPTVVCLPGITRNCRDFEDLAPALAERHPVLAPDFRGRGLSQHDAEWRNYVPRTYVGDVLALLDAEQVTQAAFIGTSLGGLVSMLLGVRHRERVAGIVLNDVGPEVGPAGLARIKEYIGRMPPVANWDEAVRQARDIYEPALPGLSDATWERIARRGYRENADGVPALDMDPNVGRAAREAGATPGDPWALFEALRDLPVVVLHGVLSDVLTDDIVRRMLEVKPDLEHVPVANRGHVPLLDEPECLAAIDRFLERLPR